MGNETPKTFTYTLKYIDSHWIFFNDLGEIDSIKDPGDLLDFIEQYQVASRKTPIIITVPNA